MNNGLRIQEKLKKKERQLIQNSSWVARLLSEIPHRLRLFFRSPNLHRLQQIEREKEFEEKRRLAEEYSQGYLAGWRECYSACLDAVETEFEKENDIWTAGKLVCGSGRPRQS